MLASLWAVYPAFLSKNLQTTEATPLWYPSYFGLLAILNALSYNALSETDLLASLRINKIYIRINKVKINPYLHQNHFMC